MMKTRGRGPRLISEEEVQSYFSEDWNINYIKEARLDGLIHYTKGEPGLGSRQSQSYNSEYE